MNTGIYSADDQLKKKTFSRSTVAVCCVDTKTRLMIFFIIYEYMFLSFPEEIKLRTTMNGPNVYFKLSWKQLIKVKQGSSVCSALHCPVPVYIGFGQTIKKTDCVIDKQATKIQSNLY